MDYFRDFAARDSVRAIVERAVKSSSVQGVIVDLDPFWLAGWQAYATLGSHDFRAWDNNVDQLYVDQRRAGWLPEADPWSAWLHRLAPPFSGHYPEGVDPWRFRFNAWRRVADARGTSDEPFVLKVIRRPGASDDRELTEQLATDSALRLVFETRPVAHGYKKRKVRDTGRPLLGGISVGTAMESPGTLGGILEDTRATRYALTCSHVVGNGEVAHHPGRRDDRAGAAIGSCVASTRLAAPSSACNPYGPKALDRVDAALIKLADGVASALEVAHIGTLSGIGPRRSLDPGAQVEVVGKRSGHRRLRVGGLALTQEVRLQGEPQCFTDIFEVKRLSATWWLTGAAAPPVRPGDSGAWVIAQGPEGAQWAGMVLGGDGPVGYAMLSECVCTWLDDQGYGGLAV